MFLFPKSAIGASRSLVRSYRGDSSHQVQILISYCMQDRSSVQPHSISGAPRQTRAMAIPNTSKTSEWESSPATFDFRSDTLTTPTSSMLSSLAHASLGDEVYLESTTTISLESRLARLFGKPAALFVLSGTMGNQLCLRAHLTQPPHSVLCDVRAHINVYEAGGLASLSQSLITGVRPSNGKWITLEDVQKEVTLGNDIHFAPTRVVSLENTINGVIMPLDEIRRISAFAREHGIKIHLDGARLWNACSVPGAPALHEYAALVDSLSVCFSKSLGAPVGSFVIGENNLVDHARHMRKAVGGGIRQAGILTAMAEVALDEVFLRGRLVEANAHAKKLEGTWTALGGRTTLPVDTNMVWLDLEGRGVSVEVWVEEAKKQGVKATGDRIVCHYQNSTEAIERLEKAMEAACRRADESKANKVVAGTNGKVKERSYLLGSRL